MTHIATAPGATASRPGFAVGEAGRLAALRSYAILDTPREAEFDDIAQMAAQACGTPMAHINFIDAHRQWIKAAVGHDMREMPLEFGFCTELLGSPDILLLSGLDADPGRSGNVLVAGAPHLRFYAGVPLVTPDGYAIGTLCVLDRVPRTLTEPQRFILKALARTVMAQLEMRRTDAALRASEERYRSLFNSIDAGFCVVEMEFDAAGRAADCRFLEVNPAFEAQTGLVGAVGRRLRDLDPDHDQPWFDISGQVALTGRPVRFENAAPALKRWYDVHAYRVDDPARHRVAILFNDITRRRENEMALLEREAESRLVADAMPALIAAIDRSFTYRFVNAAYETWFGHPREAVLGRTMSELIGPAEFAFRRPYVERALAGEEVRLERNWPWPDGRPRVADIRYLPRRTPEGSIDGVYVFVHDVTDRKRVEDFLEAKAQSLEAQIAAQARDRDRIWTLSPVLKVVATARGEVLSVNPSWVRTLGWSEAESLGRSLLDFVAPEDRDVMTGELERRLSGVPGGDIEVAFLTQTGEPRRILWTIVPEEGTLYGFGRDVSEQRRAEEALRQSQKLEAVGQLTGGVAHDFNNLLTIIRSSVDFLRRPDLPEERRRRYLDAVSDTVDRAAKLTGQLLAFARRQALKLEVIDVGVRLQAVAEMLDAVTGARIRVVTQVPDRPCFVRTDLSQFETALVNIAVNARDAMNGEGTLTLRLACGCALPAIRGHAGAPGPFAAVSLTDTGAGIPPDLIGRIFEPFFTTKEVGRGTGLGLSQVFGFAKQSGGDIAVESTPGQGTTFTLYLPQVEMADGLAGGDPDARSLSPAGNGRRVLVVEDNVEVGRFACQILQDLGFTPEWASNAEEALERLEPDGAGFDAVFSDVVMPGMGGIALARELRRRLPCLPVVLASGYSHVLAQEGAHGFELLHKPYSGEELGRLLHRVTARAPAAPHGG
ncbi:PAS domain S-box protein [Methylobacterium nodulans]|uniref:histidine kinase n=1 Tax=Methylobacterium nodulans (strain LMG 21967 / CNCM I-2342 / ORS 2060) TaxID=460265 RepID=B8IC82_METNO|nr:PAS domain S-box protein [Methylobacterium nodulans]ACL55470.1 multi-sensor hybrid histidine kinase [Methylobacterium nodulans ORS 2060]